MSTRQVLREFRAMTHRVSKSTTIALWVCLLTTIALFTLSAIVPPMGSIDPSMFKAGGYLFAFAGLFVLREAIREGLGVKMTHGDTTIQVGDLDGKEDPAGAKPDAEADPEDPELEDNEIE